MTLLKIEIDVKGALEALAGLPPAAMQAAWRRTPVSYTHLTLPTK